jgi:hypothetical protein
MIGPELQKILSVETTVMHIYAAQPGRDRCPVPWTLWRFC